MARWMSGGPAGCVGIVILAAWVGLQLGGCAAASSVGGDVAGSVAEKAVDIVYIGKVESYQVVHIDDAIATVNRVAQEMDLQEIKREKHPDQLKITYHDGRKQKIVVTVVERSETVSELHIDVGLFGVEGMARLMMRRVLHELPGGTEEEKKAVE